MPRCQGDPDADINPTSQTVQQAVQQTGVAGVDSSTYIFPVGKGMYNQTEIRMGYDSFPHFGDQPKPKTRPIILPDNQYAPPKAKHYGNFAYGNKREIPADKLGKTYNQKETNYTDQWEALNPKTHLHKYINPA